VTKKEKKHCNSKYESKLINFIVATETAWCILLKNWSKNTTEWLKIAAMYCPFKLVE
jgi:hypothetical protein